MAKKEQSKLKGVVVNNSQVAPFIRKHGGPTYSKPHGTEKTILYYPNPDFEAEGAGEFKDYAGEETPGGARTTVIQKGMHGSKVSTRKLQAGGGRTAGQPLENIGNPNRQAEEADLENEGDLDKEITEIEKEAREPSEADVDVQVTQEERQATSEKVKKVSQDPVETDVQDAEVGTQATQEDEDKKKSSGSKKSSSKKSSSKKK